MNYNFNDEDIKFIEKAIEVKNKGYYIDGKQLTNVYNRVLNKNAAPTNCGSCVRARIQELENALNHFKKTIETNVKENETITKPTPKVGRPKKKE